MQAYDLVIVGGGIGGSALARVMARSGKSVLLLEQSHVYEDRVRGEWIAPWGVAEVHRLGLYELLMSAGGHHVTRHVTYDETVSPHEAEARTLPLDIFKPGVPGPLCLGHPVHCQALFDAAGAAGAVTLRGVQVFEVVGGRSPRVAYEHDGSGMRPARLSSSAPTGARLRCERRPASNFIRIRRIIGSPGSWSKTPKGGAPTFRRSARRATSVS